MKLSYHSIYYEEMYENYIIKQFPNNPSLKMDIWNKIKVINSTKENQNSIKD